LHTDNEVDEEDKVDKEFVLGNSSKEQHDDPLNRILSKLRQANTLKLDVAYMTPEGEVKGNLILSPYLIVFDPEMCSENKHFISVLYLVVLVAFNDTSVSVFY